MDYEFLVDGDLKKITVEKKEGRFLVKEGESAYEADIQHISPGIISILTGQKSFRVYMIKRNDKRYVNIHGHNLMVQEPASESADSHMGLEGSSQDKLLVKAPMPGKVIKINVKEKEKVRKNQTLAIVEAMKMENEIKSSIDGFIKKIHVSPGDLVDSEKPLIELESGE
ncbi:MAG: acetyl-CoA carboxylase biotin carboxyl carrier protein subunit [Candidatus Aminicenantes bacterium]|jgi:biotin carboxyl carrier protein